MYFVILFGSREVKIFGSAAFDCFNPNWQVTCILVFSIHSTYVFYSWHCTRLFLCISNRISLRSMLEVPSGKMLPILSGRAFCYPASKLLKICQVKYPAMTLFQILNAMLKYILLNKLLICCRVFISFILLLFMLLVSILFHFFFNIYLLVNFIHFSGLLKLLLSIFDGYITFNQLSIVIVCYYYYCYFGLFSFLNLLCLLMDFPIVDAK